MAPIFRVHRHRDGGRGVYVECDGLLLVATVSAAGEVCVHRAVVTADTEPEERGCDACAKGRGRAAPSPVIPESGK